MAITLYIEITTERPPDIGARKWSDFAKAGMAAAAETWETRYVRHHFDTFSSMKYGYQRRRQRTRKQKEVAAKAGKAIKGGKVPLVWTGLLERQMLRRGILRVYPTRFVLQKPAGSYITERPRQGRPNMVKEITATIPSEQRAMAAAYESKAAELMNNYRATKRVKV